MTEGASFSGRTTELPGVGIVVVSHSRALARAAVALAAEMVHGHPMKIAIAAGLDESTFGTDAVRIKEAIEEVDGPDGVVVLMDLGSAMLSADLALELLDDLAARDRVVLSAAALVEGLIVATVAASGGASRTEVAAEASAALMGKAAHLVHPEEVLEPLPDDTDAADLVATFVVGNPHGLHARPAARLVGELRGMDASVRLRNLTTGAGPVPAGSLSRVATLAALNGHEVEVRASGPQAKEAIEHLLLLAGRNFDEIESAVAEVASEPAQGPLGVSPGIVIGPVRRLLPPKIQIDEDLAGDPAAQWRRVLEAVAEVRREIGRVRVLAAREIGAQEASIFDAHLMLLGDAEMLAEVKQQINNGSGAMRAWAGVLAGVEGRWAELPDPYLRARAADVRAVAEQVLRTLSGSPSAQLSGEGVLVARDLTPAEAAELDVDLVRAVVLAEGTPTSHAAILARARGIPTVVAAGRGVLGLEEGTVVIVDGGAGALVVDPSPETLRVARTRVAQLAQREADELLLAADTAVSLDGVRVEVAANVGSIADARVALASGADSVGLVRTEFLFLGRDQAPNVEEQSTEYIAIAEAMAGRRITLRTLDVGGDKPLAYLPMPVEQNPFLGLRGIRLSLERPDLLRDQLVAINRAAERRPVSVMFPMVSTVEELVHARRVLSEVAGPQGPPDGLQVGMMIEVPAAALKIETFLDHLDFVSIGTNDLTQYTLAAERGNAAVAGLSDALDPGVLALIRHVCRASVGRAAVAVCGEAASDDLAVPILVGLGVRELSVSPRAVPRVKAAIRRLDVGQCVVLADVALALCSGDEVRKLVGSTLQEAGFVLANGLAS